jgi:hypothetical protein
MHSYGICMILRITTDYFPKEQKWNVTYNGDATCFVLNIIQIMASKSQCIFSDDYKNAKMLQQP